MRQYEAVIEALRQNDGYATLGLLYQEVMKIPDVRWGTRTPNASIRRIVQDRDEIFKIKPGLWALEEFRHQLPPEILPSPETPEETVEVYDHSYYQGLLLELGRLKNFITYVPAQDKNRRFLQKKLGDIADLTKCPDFSYENIVRRTATIDVVWFNSQKLPDSVYEVEHTTGMDNSLLKFVELQDFRVRFYIVAPEARKSLFEDKIQRIAFKPIAKRVNFVNYEKVSQWHTRAHDLDDIEP